MFKSFSNLNQSLSRTNKSNKTYNLERVIQAGRSILDIARDLPSRYSRSYSQIQWMKYDDQGSPSDVTPNEQDSAASAIISEAKESLSEALSSYTAVDPITMTKPVTNVSIFGLVAASSSPFIKIQFIEDNGDLKLIATSIANITGINLCLTDWITIPGSGEKITRQNPDAIVDIYGSTFIEGFAYTNAGKRVHYIAYKSSNAGPGVLRVSCEWNGYFYAFTLGDVSHSASVITKSGSYARGDFNIIISNNTRYTASALYLMYCALGSSVPANSSFISNYTSVAEIVWSNFYNAPDLSTEVTATLSVEVNDLYPGISNLITDIQAL